MEVWDFASLSPFYHICDGVNHFSSLPGALRMSNSSSQIFPEVRVVV